LTKENVRYTISSTLIIYFLNKSSTLIILLNENNIEPIILKSNFKV